MKRKAFIKAAGLTAAGSMIVPYILPSGRLFAATGSRKVDHVVFCLFAGGVRNIESMQKGDGNLMLNTLNGNESITSDIAAAMTTLPQPAGTDRLQNLGTLFQQFQYTSGPTSHYSGHTTALTGKYAGADIQIQQPPPHPTIFEYYRKHNSPGNSALNAWWICDQLGPYPYLNYSSYPGYGAAYGANMIQPASLISPTSFTEIGNGVSLSSNQLAKCDMLKSFMNGQFKVPSQALSTGVVNTPQDAEQLQAFLNRVMISASGGAYNDPWGVGAQNMYGDIASIFLGSLVMQEFKPELTVINMTSIDIAHFNFTNYVNNIRKADFALYQLWQTIQSIPEMKDNTVLIVAPEHGRNLKPNSTVDTYGRYALDHDGDDMSREIFCLIVGPSGKVKRGQVFNGPGYQGESIDIVPTIANILGFDTQIPGGLLDGRVLSEAFL